MPAKLVLVEGPSGSGKSTAWENIDHTKSMIITPNAKDLPFAGSGKKYVNKTNKFITNSLTDVPSYLKEINDKKPEIKYILVDDFSHYFNTRVMDKTFIARKIGNDAFAKWNELAADTLPIITGNSESFRDDLFIAFNAHTELNDDGVISLRTPGKLLEKSINIVSYFTYVLQTVVTKTDKGIDYKFQTNFDGIREAKTPKGCFKDLYIPNDMKLVFDTIEAYVNGN